MSKQSEAKKAQGYTTEPSNCAGYRNLTSDRILPAWMRGRPEYEKNFERHASERNFRCSIGGFAVKKTAVCNEFKKKEAK